jgi:glyceraldehyde-3-phosphate dehydrogenase type I
MLKYDSVYGRFPAKVEAVEPKKGEEIGRIMVGEKEFPVLAQRQPEKIHWQDYGVNVVLECTGVFTDKKAELHFKAGAEKVIISAPAKDNSISTFIIGVNQERYRGERLISNGSCTTNCVAPLIKIIDESMGFEECIMTTIHAYTSSQTLVDDSGDDLRRARAGAVNIVPTGTGAAQSVIAAYPEAEGRFAASAIRVPVICGSFADFVFKTNRATAVDEVNSILEEAASNKLVGIVKVSYEPLVSTDIIGNTASAIIDLPMTQVISEDMLHLAAWYDNEYGYSCRLLEMAKIICK